MEHGRVTGRLARECVGERWDTGNMDDVARRGGEQIEFREDVDGLGRREGENGRFRVEERLRSGGSRSRGRVTARHEAELAFLRDRVRLNRRSTPFAIRGADAEGRVELDVEECRVQGTTNSA